MTLRTGYSSSEQMLLILKRFCQYLVIKKYFGSQSLSQPCDSSIEKCSAHVRGCYALKIHFIVRLILFRKEYD